MFSVAFFIFVCFENLELDFILCDVLICVCLTVCVCVSVNGSAASWEFSCEVSVNVSYTVVLAKYSSDFTQRQG